MLRLGARYRPQVAERGLQPAFVPPAWLRGVPRALLGRGVGSMQLCLVIASVLVLMHSHPQMTTLSPAFRNSVAMQ